MERRWQLSKPWDAQPITNGLVARCRSTRSPRRRRSWPGSCGRWTARSWCTRPRWAVWPGCLRPPRRPALPDQRDLAGRCRRAAPVVRARRGLCAASVCRLSIASWSRRQHASRGHRPLPVVRRYCASGGGKVRSERQPGRGAGSLPRLVPRWRRSRPPALRRHRTGLAYRVNPRAGWSQVRIGTSRQTPGASARPLLTT
jgi:hypothetical protein